MLVVDALIGILGTKQSKLEPFYWIGQDAHTLWRALHSLPPLVGDLIKLSLFYFRPVEQVLPPVDVISHVTIRVRNIETSLPFYEALGLEKLGETENGQQFLRSGSSKNRWSTLVLLQEDKSMTARGKSSDAGMTRLCIYTTNIDAEIKRLSAKGVQAMAPTAETRMAKIAAYYDPDKFVVYVIQFKNILGAAVRAQLWWNKRDDPCLFHWTINVTNAQAGLSAFEALGFNSLSDQDSDEVDYDLLPAFNVDPKTTEIKHIRLCKLPDDAFIATIMEWVHPKSELKGAELMNSMTVSVTDVEASLARARDAGMTTEPAKYQRLPVFGEVLVGAAFVEPGCNRVEFCCFTNKQ
jgi:catechol 2,3-dioxygenase-like lactoylglutathione lyase family enzyme